MDYYKKADYGKAKATMGDITQMLGITDLMNYCK